MQVLDIKLKKDLANKTSFRLVELIKNSRFKKIYFLKDQKIYNMKNKI